MPDLNDAVVVDQVDGRSTTSVPAADDFSSASVVEPERPSVISHVARQVVKWLPIEQVKTAFALEQQFPDLQSDELFPPYSKRVNEAMAVRDADIERQGIGNVLRTPMLIGIGAGLATAPLETAAVVGGFTLKDKFINFRRGVEHQFPQAWPEVKDAAEIADWAVFGGIFGGGAKAIGDRVSGRLNAMKLPSSVNLTPDHLGTLKDTPSLSEHFPDVLKTLGITPQQLDASLSGGHQVNVPMDKMIDLAHKPYWNTIKGALSLPEEPSEGLLAKNQTDLKQGKSSAFRDFTTFIKRAILNRGNPYLMVKERFGGTSYAEVIKAIHLQERTLLGFDNQKSSIFDKTFSEVEKSFGKYTDKELRTFNLTRGTPSSPDAQALQQEAFKVLPESLRDANILKGITEVSDYVFNYAQQSGIDLNYFEDYFFGSYKDSKKVGKFLDYWRSTEMYTKQKSLPTVADAEAFGLQLKDQNPITNLLQEMRLIGQRAGLLKLRRESLGFPTADETSKTNASSSPTILNVALSIKGQLFEGATHAEALAKAVKAGVLTSAESNAYNLESSGLFRVSDQRLITRDQAQSEFGIRHSEQIPNQKIPPLPIVHDYAVLKSVATKAQRAKWDTINDPVFKDMLFDPDYAKFVNSLISTNKIEQNLFLKGLRGSSKVAQVAKFFGSIFHMRNETMEIISDEAGGVVNPKGYKNFAKNFKAIDRTTPEYAEYVGLGGGHEYAVEPQAIKLFGATIDKLSKGALRGLGQKLEPVYKQTKWIPASPEMIRWMFEDYIPAIKYNKFLQEVAGKEDTLGRPLMDSEKIDVIRTNQNFYGEMNERLFGRSATVTSALRLIFSAPGYGEGNFRATFGSMKELQQAFPDLVNLAKGKGLKGDYRNIQFVMNSFVTALVMSQIGTRIMSGRWGDAPKIGEDIRDLFKIKTNLKDGNGDPVYYDMMGYSNDFWTFYGLPTTGQVGKIPGALARRLTGAESPIFKTTVDLGNIFAGKPVYDFRGQPVFQKTDDFITQFNKFLAYEGLGLLPISTSTYQQSRKKGVGIVQAVGAAVLGIRATTSERVKTLKDARQDLFSIQDTKRQKQLELDKQYAENPQGALAAIDQFNASQVKKLATVFKTIGGVDFDPSEINTRFLIDAVKGNKVAEGTEEAVRSLLTKQKTQKREKVMTKEQEQQYQEQLGQ